MANTFKKSEQSELKLTDLIVDNGNIISDNEIIDLQGLICKLFEDCTFKITVTTKNVTDLDLDD